MKKQPSAHNHLKELMQRKGIKSLALAKKIGTSAPHMSRLVNGKSPLTHEWIHKLSAALKVPTSQIVGLDMNKKFMADCDDVLLGNVMSWLLAASEDQAIELSRSELTKLTSFIYKEAVSERLNLDEVRYLAGVSVKMKILFKK